MGSPFGSDITETFSLPGDPVNTITIKKLGARQWEQCSDAFMQERHASMEARGGKAKLDELSAFFRGQQTPKPEPEVAPEPAPDVDPDEVPKYPIAGMSEYELCALGIASWTYDKSLQRAPVESATPDGHKVTTMRILAIDDLGPDDLEYIALKVGKLTKPSLFLSKTQQEAAKVKG